MGLREQAEADLGMIIEDRSFGFGWDITLTDPNGKTEPLVGLSTDISLAIDPDTGVLVSGRTASVTLRISTLRAKGFQENPRNITENNKYPWVIGIKDINGVPCLFKVIRSDPDRAIGAIVLFLEVYKQAFFYNGAWIFDGTDHYDGVLKYL